ncbi:hypothetical protein S7711_02605 [Stachybotrys chartarum IBT 7711]|uniref:Uncharacterized protein n=1 Tax=Stachybotrys chartarum (strain CBS 109288 / IBT 7711) TaxID=1280523 RepID=A0A084B8Y2_STACB|nr:hypothetical protein S7711_02605 [Stachybotrys chartarum IBT 7711]KFA56281.1 hypothetical protein S40293_00221 [Stachybotrys chartarum IBT 40293]KFA81270.1 hypothetical protein S40288_04853 [Stachybotrys chartarum IBT 40288]
MANIVNKVVDTVSNTVGLGNSATQSNQLENQSNRQPEGSLGSKVSHENTQSSLGSTHSDHSTSARNMESAYGNSAIGSGSTQSALNSSSTRNTQPSNENSSSISENVQSTFSSNNPYSNSSTQPRTQPGVTQEVRSMVDPAISPQHDQRAPSNTNVNENIVGERDPRDASHVPPSVMAQHLGAPDIEHDYPHDSKTKRHSVSAQEEHLMG